MVSQRTKRKLSDHYAQNKEAVEYKDIETLRRFLSPEGKILPSRRSGLNAKHQRKATRAIKQARVLGLLPFATSEY